MQAQDTLYKHHVSVNWQNDLFLKLDKDFTNGIELSYLAYAGRFKIPRVKKRGQAMGLPNAYREYSIVQHIFTPENLGTDEIIYEDRPYAGYLYMRLKSLGLSKGAELIFTLSWELGILGPAAYGGEIQDFIHDNTPSPAPEGWDNQIQNDLVLNFNFGMEKALVNRNAFVLTVPSLLKAGTLYTNLSTGLKLRWGKFQEYFGSPYNLSVKDKIQYYLDGGAGIQLIAYNATLQGGVFSDKNQHVIATSDVERLVYFATARLNFSYKRMLINGGVRFTSKTYEFGESHRYGFIGLGYSFN